MLKEQILLLFPERIKKCIEILNVNFENLQEIRIRIGAPMILVENGYEHLIETEVSQRDIREIVDVACGYSGYAFEEELKKGYITVEGGHRIGLAGRTVVEDGAVRTIKNISSLNVRVSHAVAGCAKKWRNYFYERNKPCHVLIISPPGCGKTTCCPRAGSASPGRCS